MINIDILIFNYEIFNLSIKIMVDNKENEYNDIESSD